MDVVFIRPEEAKMEKEFGDAFRQYKQKIRRWI
jgi:protein-S-isoprenylcysteine O-methyltransferase Ste14